MLPLLNNNVDALEMNPFLRFLLSCLEMKVTGHDISSSPGKVKVLFWLVNIVCYLSNGTSSNINNTKFTKCFFKFTNSKLFFYKVVKNDRFHQRCNGFSQFKYIMVKPVSTEPTFVFGINWCLVYTV